MALVVLLILGVLPIIWWAIFMMPPVIIFWVIYTALSIKIINTREAAIVEFLWKFNRILSPWLNFVIPVFENIVKKASLKTQSLKISVDSYAKDNVKLRIWIDILFYVNDAKEDVYKSYYSLENPISAIQSIVDNSLRAKINTFEHIEVLSKRDEFSDYLEEVLWAKLHWWGYKTDSIQITDIDLPVELVSAMNKVKTTEREKEAAENEWEAERILSVKKAEAERETKKLNWLWIAQQREEIAKWLKRSVEEFKEALGQDANPNEIMNIILMTNYFDTLKDIWDSGETKVMFTNWTPWALSEVREMILQGIEWAKESKNTSSFVKKATAKK